MIVVNCEPPCRRKSTRLDIGSARIFQGNESMRRRNRPNNGYKLVRDKYADCIASLTESAIVLPSPSSMRTTGRCFATVPEMRLGASMVPRAGG
jgi:hypothetical protein